MQVQAAHRSGARRTKPPTEAVLARPSRPPERCWQDQAARRSGAGKTKPLGSRGAPEIRAADAWVGVGSLAIAIAVPKQASGTCTTGPTIPSRCLRPAAIPRLPTHPRTLRGPRNSQGRWPSSAVGRSGAGRTKAPSEAVLARPRRSVAGGLVLRGPLWRVLPFCEHRSGGRFRFAGTALAGASVLRAPLWRALPFASTALVGASVLRGPLWRALPFCGDRFGERSRIATVPMLFRGPRRVRGCVGRHGIAAGR
jgi:hypothetical protein